MGKIISFFNHKGGVGKTTTVCNLASALANKGKKVLVIDADPQMNLTASIYGLGLGVQYSQNIKNQEDYEKIETETISQQNDKWIAYSQQYLSLFEFLGRYLYPRQTKSDKQKPYYRKLGKEHGFIDLMSGSIETIGIEVNLYSAVTNDTKSGKELLNGFQEAVNYIKNQDYDFVLIDSAPNASSVMTALLLLLGDYWIAPVIPSFYSLQAIDNLESIMQRWRDRLGGDGFGLSRFAEEGLINLHAKFLGILVQQSKRYKVSSGSSQGWINDLNRRLEDYFVEEKKANKPQNPTFVSSEEFNIVFPSLASHQERKPHIIYSCYDFTQSLRSIADRIGIPVIELTHDLVKEHKLFDGYDIKGKIIWKRPIRQGLESYEGQPKKNKKGEIVVDKNGNPKMRDENQYYIAHTKTLEAYNQIADDLINNLNKI